MACALWLQSPAPAAPAGWRLVEVALYQTDPILQERVADVEGFAAYLKRLEAMAGRLLAGTASGAPVHIVVALKPGRKAKTWTVPARVPGVDLAGLRRQLDGLEAPVIRDGPVAAALVGRLTGARAAPEPAPSPYRPPLPEEWRLALAGSKGPVAIPDEILPRVWPDQKQ